MDVRKAIASAQRAIAANGQRVILLTYTDSTPDNPSLPWRGGGTGAVETEARAVFLGIKLGHFPEAGKEGASTIKQGTIREEANVLLSTAGIFRAPQVNDEIQQRDGGKKWRVETVEKLAPSGTTILYKLTVTR